MDFFYEIKIVYLKVSKKIFVYKCILSRGEKILMKIKETASVFKMILRVTHHKTINISKNEFWFKGK